MYILSSLDDETLLWSPIRNCYEYDPNNNSWTTLPSMSKGQARGASAMGVRSSIICLAGGLIVLDAITGAQTTVEIVTSYNTKTQE